MIGSVYGEYENATFVPLFPGNLRTAKWIREMLEVHCIAGAEKAKQQEGRKQAGQETLESWHLLGRGGPRAIGRCLGCITYPGKQAG